MVTHPSTNRARRNVTSLMGAMLLLLGQAASSCSQYSKPAMRSPGSCRASPSFGQYQIILLSDEGTSVKTIGLRLLCSSAQPGVLPVTYESQVQHPTLRVQQISSYG